MPTAPTTVSAYLASLPDDRRKAINAIRKVINANLDPKIQEGIQYGMLGYFVPHKHYPAGYHCDPKQPLPFVGLGSQKNHMAMYLFCIYLDEAEAERFAKKWKATGKKLDMGKSCVRFKKLEDVPLEVVGETIARFGVASYIEGYEASLAAPRKGPAKKKASKKKASKKKVAKKAAAKKKPAAKKAAKKTVARKPAAKKAAGKKAAGKKAATKKKAAAPKKS